MHRILLIPLMLFLVSVCSAQTTNTITVCVTENKPFVITNPNGVSTGFDIDYWNAIGERLHRNVVFVSAPNLKEKLKMISNGKCDAAAGGITITSDREKEVDFTHPYFNSGLSILCRSDDTVFGVKEVWLCVVAIKWPAIILVVFIVVIAHLMWFVEIGEPDIADSYLPGIFDALWWSVVTIGTVGYGDMVPHKWRGRLFAMVTILVGITFYGATLSILVSKITNFDAGNRFNCLHDLSGKTVGVKEGSTSVNAVESSGVNVRQVPDIRDAYDLLLKKKVSAVVYDYPSLMYFAKTEGDGNFKVVGDVFNKQYYGYALKEGSKLREEINRAHVYLMEQGMYDKIYKKYFDGM